MPVCFGCYFHYIGGWIYFKGQTFRAKIWVRFFSARHRLLSTWAWASKTLEKEGHFLSINVVFAFFRRKPPLKYIPSPNDAMLLKNDEASSTSCTMNAFTYMNILLPLYCRIVTSVSHISMACTNIWWFVWTIVAIRNILQKFLYDSLSSVGFCLTVLRMNTADAVGCQFCRLIRSTFKLYEIFNKQKEQTISKWKAPKRVQSQNLQNNEQYQTQYCVSFGFSFPHSHDNCHYIGGTVESTNTHSHPKITGISVKIRNNWNNIKH